MTKKWAQFRYDPNSPSGLVWASNRYSGKDLRILHALAGSAAGSQNNQGYWMVWDQQTETNIGCHCIVFEVVSKTEVPQGFEVDHEDGNRANNLYSNLRLVDDAGNSRNRRLTKSSATGVQGVYWQVNGAVTYAVARWTDMVGKSYKKYFSATSLGITEAFKRAVSCRASAIEFLNTQGAGYTARHGK